MTKPDPLPCARFKRFKSRDAAYAAAVAISNRGGRSRLPEPCHHCNGWHLSR